MRRLAALPQPEPSPELDAAIFAQVQKDLAPGPSAANDPATQAQRPGLLQRYRAPLAFAASLAGLAILLPVWRSMPQHATQPAAEPPAVNADAEKAVPPSPALEPAPAQQPESGIAAGQLHHTKPVLSPSMSAPTEARMEAAAPPPPPPAPPAAAPPEPAAPATAAIAAAPAPAPAASAPTVRPTAAAAPAAPTAARVAPMAPVPPAPAIAPAAETEPLAEVPTPADKAGRREKSDTLARSGIPRTDAKEWLQTIERLLDAGDTKAAAAQWKRFRQAHPDYPVPDTLAERLKAAQ